MSESCEVKEPEKHGKTTKSQPAGKTKQDIRNYIPTIDKKSSDTRLNNISAISTNNSDTKIETVIPKSSNIFGFTNSNGGSSSSSSSSTSQSNGDGGGGLRGSVRNNSSTVFITKKPSTLTKVEIVNPKPAVTAGRTTSEPQKSPNQDYSVVRNHWTNKFPVKSGIKRHSEENDTSSEKMPKLSLPSFECPICNKKFSEELLNTHIDDCLGKNDPQKCIICEISVPTSEYQAHIGKCAEEAFKDDVFEETGTEPSKKIPSPSKNSEGEEFSEVDKGDEQCEVCDRKISVKEYPTHVNECFHKMFNNIEAKFDNGIKEETTDCLACGDKILKSELNSHLEDCLSMSKIFDDENEPIAPETNDEETNKDKYNCPVCTNLFTKEAMSDHIDECLGIVDLCES